MEERTRRPIEHTLVKMLRAVPDFAPLDDSILLKILGASANLVWPEGSTIFEKGSPGDALYLVLRGEVRVFDRPDDEISRIGPGGYFGDRSLFKGEAHSKTVQSVALTELMVVPKESFEALIGSDQEVAAHFRRIFRERAISFDAPRES